jgi:hypothetical protein
VDEFDGLDDEKVQEKLNQYHEAFKQEFETSVKKNPENVDEYTREFFRDNLPMAAAQIAFLAANAESESVRFSASKYVILAAKEISETDGDPIKELLKELSGKSSAKS